MKLKSLFFASVLLSGLTACSSDDNLVDNSGKQNDATLNLGVNMANLSTRGGGSKLITKINQGSLFLMDGTSVSGQFKLADAHMTSINDGNATEVEVKNVPQSLTKVVFAGNHTVNSAATEDVIISSSFDKSIVEIQPTAENPGVDGAYLYGESSEVIGDAKNKTASITIKPYIARLEVSGDIKLPSGSTLEVVALNNVAKTANASTTADFDIVGAQATDLSAMLLTSSTAVFNKHLYPQNSGVDVILAIKTGSKTEYVTLTMKGENTLGKIAGGVIYKLNLKNIDWNGDGNVDEDEVFEPGTGGDKPGDAKSQISVHVELKEWEYENITLHA